MPSGTPRSWRERANAEIYFLSPTHPPFSMQCQATLQVRVHFTTVFLFRYPRRSGLAELTVLCEGTILAVVYDDSLFTYGFTWTWDWLLGISYPMHLIVSSRISFSARPLSDVAASQVPSVAAAAGFLNSFSRRCNF